MESVLRCGVGGAVTEVRSPPGRRSGPASRSSLWNPPGRRRSGRGRRAQSSPVGHRPDRRRRSSRVRRRAGMTGRAAADGTFTAGWPTSWRRRPGAAPRRPEPSRRRPGGSSCGSGWRCSSTANPTSRTGCWPGPRRAWRATPWSRSSASVDGRPVCVIANDFTVKAGTWGRRTFEKITDMQELADALGAAARVPRRRRRRPHRRAVRQLRRTPRLGQHLLQPGPLLGPGAAGLRPVRALAGRVGLRAGAVRRDDHGPGPRHRLHRLPPPGRDGHRGAGDDGGDGRGRDALPRVGPRRRPRRRRRGGHRRRTAVAVVLAAVVAGGAAARERRLPTRAAHRPIEEIVPTREDVPFDMQRAHRGRRRRGHASFRTRSSSPRSWSPASPASAAGRSGSLANQSLHKAGVLFTD